MVKVIQAGSLSREERGKVAYMVLMRDFRTKKHLAPSTLKKEAGDWARELDVPVRTVRAMMADLLEQVANEAIDALRAL